MSAVCGGVRFSLSFVGLLHGDFVSLGAFDRDNRADKPVEDLGLFNLVPPSHSCPDSFGGLTLSFPIKDFRDTALFVFLCIPGRLQSSSYTSTGLRGEERIFSLLALWSFSPPSACSWLLWRTGDRRAFSEFNIAGRSLALIMAKTPWLPTFRVRDRKCSKARLDGEWLVYVASLGACDMHCSLRSKQMAVSIDMYKERKKEP